MLDMTNCVMFCDAAGAVLQTPVVQISWINLCSHTFAFWENVHLPSPLLLALWAGSVIESTCLFVCLRVCLCVWCPVPMRFFQGPYWPPDHIISDLASCWSIRRINQVAADWQDQPGTSQLAGSTRYQPIGMINQLAARKAFRPPHE